MDRDGSSFKPTATPLRSRALEPPIQSGGDTDLVGAEFSNEWHEEHRSQDPMDDLDSDDYEPNCQNSARYDSGWASKIPGFHVTP